MGYFDEGKNKKVVQDAAYAKYILWHKDKVEFEIANCCKKLNAKIEAFVSELDDLEVRDGLVHFLD